MKIKDYQCKCGHNDFFFADKGNQNGIYCSYCGKWFKWADKDKQNLAMKQEHILDKVIDEIELKEKTLTDKYGQQKYGIWTDDVLQIIDKYKAEMRGEEVTYAKIIAHGSKEERLNEC